MAICARRPRSQGQPRPGLVLFDGEPVSSEGGTFYLDLKHHGKRSSNLPERIQETPSKSGG